MWDSIPRSCVKPGWGRWLRLPISQCTLRKAGQKPGGDNSERAAGLKPKIKIAFASGTDELNARLIERMRAVFPELPLYVVAEFAPAEKELHWVRYRGGLAENLARCRSAFQAKSIRLAGVLLVPDVPFRRMRLLALILAPFYFLAVNENLNDFMLRPGSLPAIARHFIWRIGNFFRWHLS